MKNKYPTATTLSASNEGERGELKNLGIVKAGSQRRNQALRSSGKCRTKAVLRRDIQKKESKGEKENIMKAQENHTAVAEVHFLTEWWGP